ncbi:MAG: ABC transporter permease [Acidimicrobiia bacterium]
MRQYIVRRLLFMPFLVLAVSILVFVMTRMGGSPIGAYLEPGMTQEEVTALEERFHINDPLPSQYWAWLTGVATGDMGWSAVAGAPVADVFPQKIAASAELAAAAGLAAILIGVKLGTFAAVRRNRLPDQLTRVFAVGGASMPTFWFAIILLLIFWARLGWFPSGRSDAAIWDSIAHPTNFYVIDSILAFNLKALQDALWHLVLPATVLAYGTIGIIARMMRSSLLEEMGRDYVDAARARGLPERLVVRRHARRNALVPTITVIGLSIGILFEGTVVVESIFAWPGLGQWLADAVLSGDQATTLAYVIFTSVVFLVVNLGVDLTYGFLDRRVVLRQS